MLSEEQEMIWLCGSGAAFGEAAAAGDAAAADAAGDGAAFELECALNAIENTSTMIASGANATADHRFMRFTGRFMVDLASVTWNRAGTASEKRARSIPEEKKRLQRVDRLGQTKSENSR
jgi:hypothetical protein